MENTQVINWDADEEEETEVSSGPLGYSLEPIGRLRLFSSAHGPERDFPLYLGKNVIGRSPDCSVALPFPSISKQHAVIEISACNKAPILQDCGSLNGTQLVKPPKVLAPGVSHRLRDRELILFADFPCQYHRLDVPPPLVSRGLLTIEKTPRLQGGSQTSRVLLAEDSEEEMDFLSDRCVANGSRNATSPSATVVPESDEEGSSPAPSVPGPSLPLDLGSDTDEEQGEQTAVGGSSSAARNGIQLVQAQPAEQKFKDPKVTSGAALAGLVVEKSPTPGEDSDTDVDEEHQPSVDSDTDMEEERIPVTPPVVPGKKKKKQQQRVLLGVGTKDPGAPEAAQLQDSPAGSDTDVEEGKVPLTVPQERNHTSMVIDSDTDEEDEVSSAFTLAHLKERGITLWSRDPGVEEVKSQPQVLVERSQSASGRDSDTDVEEGRREVVPDSPMDLEEAPVTHSESQPPHRPGDVDEDVDMSSPGGHLEGNQASSATIDNNGAQEEEEILPEPAVTLGEKHQLPPEEAQPPEDGETAVEEGSSSAVADARKSQQPVAEDTGTESAAAGSEQEGTLEVGAQSRPPATPVEQVMVCTGTPGGPTQPQREEAQTPTGTEKGAQMDRTQNAKGCCDESEDLCLPATQCFVKRESQSSEAVQSLEDEPTQVFSCILPQEPGPSHVSLQTPGPGALDVPWEVLATQPFCLREPEASEPRLIATHLEAPGSSPSPTSAPPGHQHLVPKERLGLEGREIQTVEKAMGIPKETADRVTSEREPLGRTPNSGREDVMEEEELTQGKEDREPEKVLARDRQGQESGKVKGRDCEGSGESSKVETEMSKDTQKREREVGNPEPESEWEPAGLEVTLDRGSTEGGSHDQTEQIADLGMGDLEELASALVVSGSRGDGGKGDPVSPGRQQRGHLSFEMASAEKASKGDPEPPAHCLLSSVPEASAPPQSLFTSQSQKQSTPQPLFLTSSPSEIQLPGTLHTKPNVRPRRSSRMTSSPHSSAAPRPASRTTRGRANRSSTRTPEPTIPTDSELQPPTSTEQPVIPKPPSQGTQGSTNSSFVNTPEPVVLTGPEIQPPTSTEQPVNPNSTPRATRSRPSRSSIKTPEPLIPVGSELQPLTSTEQPVIPKPTSPATRGRPRKSSVRTPEPIVPTGPELQPPTSTEQPVNPKPTSQSSRGRSSKSVRTPEPIVPTGHELQPPTSTEQPVNPKPTSQSSRGRSSKSVRTPEPTVPTGHELQPPTSTEQPVTPEPSSQGRTHRSSVRTPEASIPTTSELQSFTSREQPAHKPTALSTRGRRCKASNEGSESVGPVAPDFGPPISKDHLVTPEMTGQSMTLKSSPLSAPPVSTTPKLQPPVPTAQPVPLEPIPQASHRRRRKAAGKQGSHTVPIGHEPYSASSEPESQSSTGQGSGALETAESITVTPEPAVPQVPETPTHSPLMQNEAAGRLGPIPKPQPEASRVRKKPSTTTDSPVQKRSRRQVPQKTTEPKEEDLAEIQVKEESQERAIPTPDKRKRHRAEDETQGNPSRSRRAKPNQEVAAPKVLFTGVVDSRGERAVLALGGSLASSVNEASHLVTDRIRRTVKFLCALGKGIPILSLNWLYQSRKAGCFLPPDDYLVTDPEQEKNFSFSLRDALSRARERRLLEGYEIHVTPGVQPPPPQMGEIISCCGGTVLPSMPHSYKVPSSPAVFAVSSTASSSCHNLH
ncbi:mediator of DNA damage checkpoint protein 1 isoform X1 [Peromyscus maniculatus bairdii]|uniref:mediator of DNA damage checkpoint protein 1 isoform X1 n=1 Tax=Peromyscus maniculatus bairdii TaxID=230844 RepID=UPI00077D9C68